jgi:flagellar protein FlgJ
MDGLRSAALGPLTQAEPDLEGLARRVRQGDKAALPALGRQFEALFLAQLVKEMRQTLESDGLFGKDGGDVMGGLFDLYLGQHLAGGGGLGLAPMLQRQLGTEADQHPTPPATAPCKAITRKYQLSA